MRLRAILQSALNEPAGAWFPFVSKALGVATVISILGAGFEAVPAFAEYRAWFKAVEWTTVLIFTIEYVMRLYAARPMRSYALSFFGLVDLVAILPTFLGLGNFTFLKAARAVRIMRIIRIVSLAQNNTGGGVKNSARAFWLAIAQYAVAFVLLIFSLGLLLHISTGDAAEEGILSSVDWIFSVSIGGIPASIPPGNLGTAMFVIARFCGMLLLGLMVGVVGNAIEQAARNRTSL